MQNVNAGAQRATKRITGVGIRTSKKVAKQPRALIPTSENGPDPDDPDSEEFIQNVSCILSLFFKKFMELLYNCHVRFPFYLLSLSNFRWKRPAILYQQVARKPTYLLLWLLHMNGDNIF